MANRSKIDDLRIVGYESLISPKVLIKNFPTSDPAREKIRRHRSDISEALHYREDQMIVVVGPCSIHDVVAAKEYARRLANLRDSLSERLKIVMRVYFEKPRTTIGWKGLINDPTLDQKYRINDGLRMAREFLLFLADIDIPAGCEFLDTITPQYIADLVSWGAIGARTTESQVHRELASGLSCPVGFKNGTNGQLGIAMDAIKAASHKHHFLSVTKEGNAAIVETAGNQDCHLILRGSDKGPNFGAENIECAINMLRESRLRTRIMIDCSHGNSGKNFRLQGDIFRSLINQYICGNSSIFGLMLESHLVEGSQSLGKPETLVYGKSITDSCIGWDETAELLQFLSLKLDKK